MDKDTGIADGVRIVRSARARRLSITVKHTGEVRLTIPRGVSEAEALRFLELKREWIEKSRERAARRCPREIISMPYSTSMGHFLQLDPCATRRTSAHISGERIVVSYPMDISPDTEQVQEAIKRGIEEAWRLEAKDYLPQRVKTLAAELGLKCGVVTIRNTRTRWGSCSSSNDISLSLHLMKLPSHLIDYIIIHELCHVVHKNHGPKFHALLNKYTGGEHPNLHRMLKDYHTRW